MWLCSRTVRHCTWKVELRWISLVIKVGSSLTPTRLSVLPLRKATTGGLVWQIDMLYHHHHNHHHHHCSTSFRVDNCSVFHLDVLSLWKCLNLTVSISNSWPLKVLKNENDAWRCLKVLKFSCRILETFGSLGPSAGIAQFVMLPVENLVPFWQLKVWRVFNKLNIL